MSNSSKKHKRSKKQLPYAGSLAIKEGVQLVQTTRRDEEIVDKGIRQEAAQASQKAQHAPPWCIECYVVGHKENQCAQ
jgi:hypothetical protein